MNFSQIWNAVSIVILAIVAMLVFLAGRKERILTPFAGLRPYYKIVFHAGMQSIA